MIDPNESPVVASEPYNSSETFDDFDDPSLAEKASDHLEQSGTLGRQRWAALADTATAGKIRISTTEHTLSAAATVARIPSKDPRVVSEIQRVREKREADAERAAFGKLSEVLLRIRKKSIELAHTVGDCTSYIKIDAQVSFPGPQTELVIAVPMEPLIAQFHSWVRSGGFRVSQADAVKDKASIEVVEYDPTSGMLHMRGTTQFSLTAIPADWANDLDGELPETGLDKHAIAALRRAMRPALGFIEPYADRVRNADEHPQDMNIYIANGNCYQGSLNKCVRVPLDQALKKPFALRFSHAKLFLNVSRRLGSDAQLHIFDDLMVLSSSSVRFSIPLAGETMREFEALMEEFEPIETWACPRMSTFKAFHIAKTALSLRPRKTDEPIRVFLEVEGRDEKRELIWRGSHPPAIDCHGHLASVVGEQRVGSRGSYNLETVFQAVEFGEATALIELAFNAKQLRIHDPESKATYLIPALNPGVDGPRSVLA